MNSRIKPGNHLYKYLFVMLALCISAWTFYTPLQGGTVTDVKKITVLPPVAETYRIQLAILLDTSNSMDGLIDQARNQLWQVVNEFSQTTRNGVSPMLEVAVYEYGHSALPVENGYIRKVTGLTRDLDKVSEALFSLTTNGGDEYCGYVIRRALDELEWSRSDDDIRAIFIAGNEPFTQGPVHFREVLAQAKLRDITVNTIHAGEYNDGVQGGWQEGALLAGGNYMSIDHNHKIVHIQAPQDNEIAILNRELNSTYVPYGAEGSAGLLRQAEMDETNENVSTALLAKRVRSKASGFYSNESWDLVDAMASGAASPEALAPEDLPAVMQDMDEQERKDYVMEQSEKRERIKQEIAKLSQDRDDYVKEQKSLAGEPEAVTIENALSEAVRAQGEVKGYKF